MKALLPVHQRVKADSRVQNRNRNCRNERRSSSPRLTASPRRPRCSSGRQRPPDSRRAPARQPARARIALRRPAGARTPAVQRVSRSPGPRTERASGRVTLLHRCPRPTNRARRACQQGIRSDRTCRSSNAGFEPPPPAPRARTNPSLPISRRSGSRGHLHKT
jgi:hypothetical protein